ncbi:MAG: SGNH/GDSL hydrolase family protein [Planctomycetaceae bacterium]|jgi:lysophospholipase L1-like esterase|nr:SGNH/GDSL hydrolase family protein [Planctomycetaceae bacterium]
MKHKLLIIIGTLFLLFPNLLLAQAVPPQGEPTNPTETAQQNKAPQGVDQKDYDAYRSLVSALSVEEQAWEQTLEKYLGGFYFPLHLKDKLAKRSNAWDFVKDDPNLPRIILIGDSISRSYTQPVRKLLEGKANVHRAPANCGPTTTGLREIDGWLTEGQGNGNWDIIVFNFGIHDRNRSTKEYAENLEKLLKKLQKTGAKLLWVRTTPFNDKNDPADAPLRGSHLNEVADKMMKEHGVPICDLYTTFAERAKELIGEDRTHFTETGQKALAEEIYRSITPLLEKNP